MDNKNCAYVHFGLQFLNEYEILQAAEMCSMGLWLWDGEGTRVHMMYSINLIRGMEVEVSYL